MKRIQLILTLCLCISMSIAWTQHNEYCGSDLLEEQKLKENPNLTYENEIIEKKYRQYIHSPESTSRSATVYIPVVFHIIHANGPENIEDDAVHQGLYHLNQAFANAGAYYDSFGVDTKIQFCLAQRDEEGSAFTGITRTESPYTDMALSGALTAIRELSFFDKEKYFNIHVVKNVCVGGDCTAAGMGGAFTAVIEADFLGANAVDDIVIIHEMGHALGLDHLFKGGCTNANCLEDGDKVCDTPPDSRTNELCYMAHNSCNSDTDDTHVRNPFRPVSLGGLGDQVDDHTNFMDYNWWECLQHFTAGQAARMHFFLETRYASLMNSAVCLPPCENEVVALFDLSDSIAAGQEVALSNLSSHADTYQWYLDDQPISTDEDLTYIFSDLGVFDLTLEAHTNDTLCESDSFIQSISIYCPVSSCIDYIWDDQYLIFEPCTEDAEALSWTLVEVDGDTIHTSNDGLDSTLIEGYTFVQLCLEASNAHCSQRHCEYITLTSDESEICNDGFDNDGDGFIDLYDIDCPCEIASFQAQCQSECEVAPDSFPDFKMKMKWQSEVIGSRVVGNICIGPSQGTTTVFSKTTIFNSLSDVQNNISFIDGNTGITRNKFKITDSLHFDETILFIAVADVTNSGTIFTYTHKYDGYLYCYDQDGIQKWKSPIHNLGGRGTPGLADFNHDGIPEVYASNTILNSLTGAILFEDTLSSGCNSFSNIPGMDNTKCSISFSVAANLTSKPGLELAAGNRVYELSITNLNGKEGNSVNVIEAPSPVTDGNTALADFDGDGLLDVIVSRSVNFQDGGGIYIWDPRTRQVIASAPADIDGSIPFVGDVDGDCLLEMGIVYYQKLNVYDYDHTSTLKLKYSIPTTDDSGHTGMTMFDFNQDGIQEIIYRDETDLRIIDGPSGTTLSSTPVRSGTAAEFPIVADVDNDGEAEILVNGYIEDNDEYRIYCFESDGSPWAPARAVWNQAAYHVTNVNDDLTIPRHPQNQAAFFDTEECAQITCPQPYNSFMAQATYRSQEGCVVWPSEEDCISNEVCDDGIDNDLDGFVDLYDSDCPCEDLAFQAQCPTECEVVPDSFPGFRMKMKWQSEVIGSNFIGNIACGDINSDSKIDIITKKTVGIGVISQATNYILNINGSNGTTYSEFRHSPDNSFSQHSKFVALGDIDRDGHSELFTIRDDTLVCYNYSGETIWKSHLNFNKAAPSLADFNGDGVPEIYVGNQIFNSTNGILLFEDTQLSGCSSLSDSAPLDNSACDYANTIAADFTDSPGLELAAGNIVYEITIENINGKTGNSANIINAPLVVSDGLTSVGDIDLDGHLDIIVNRNSNYQDGGGLWIWNPRSSVLIASAPAGTDGSISFIGNLDDDCNPEIGIVYSYELRVFEYNSSTNLNLKYSIPTTDDSGHTGLTMFDFNQDGIQEIVYRDETDLRIIDGPSGTTLSSTPMRSGTAAEFPIVADVDNDGEAEILVNGYIEDNDEYRIYCFESDGSPWAPARAVWNQAAYHVTNVNDDLTIPRHPQNQAAFFDTEACAQLTCPQPYNSFMAQATYRSQEGCVVWPSEDLDLQVTADVKCVRDSMEVCFYTTCNDTTVLLAGVQLACYDNTSSLLSLITITNDTTCIMMASDSDLDWILVVIDEDNAVSECDESNNTFELDISAPDLSIDIFDTSCSADSLTLFIAIDNVGRELDQQCVTGGCYFSDPAQNTPVEITSWCFEYDDASSNHSYRDTFIMSVPLADAQSGMWWTINEGGFGPGYESALITNIFECNYDNNIDYIPFDFGDKVMDLGPDIVKCASEVVVLNAGSGFESYIWSDFTTDSIYSSSFEGLHHVEARDQCGRIYRDSVRVTFDHTQDISLGEDITLCMDEEATLNIINDYDEIRWYPKESVDCDTCASVHVIVDTSLTLFVSGLKANCSSTDTIHIERIIPEMDTSRQSYCDGDIIDFFGQQITETNIYTHISSDCQRLDVLDVVFQSPDTTLQERQICENDSTLFNGLYYEAEGVYTHLTQNQFGCDSLVLLDLRVSDVLETKDTLSMCQGDSILVFDQWVVKDTSLSILQSSTSGCDSMHIVDIRVQSLPMGTEEVSICDGDSLYLYDTWFTEEGEFTIQKTNQFGCDSIIAIGINYRPDIIHHDTISFCHGDTLDIMGFTITESTDVSQSYNASNGCDSTIYIHTQEIFPFFTEEKISICPGDSILINNEWLYESGQYDLPYTSSHGCDSTHTVIINRLEEPANPWLEVNCDNEEVILNIASSDSWKIYWDNGDSTAQTTYVDQDQAILTLYAEPKCEKQFTIELPEIIDSDQIRMPNDTILRSNSALTLDLGLNKDEWTIFWTTSEPIDCDTCITATITPQQDAEVSVYLIHSSGCTFESIFNIIIEDTEMIIPNIFSPNNDGQNDTWEILESEGFEITSLQILDRWGNLVHNPKGGRFSWNGMIGGRFGVPGVYIYRICYNDKFGKKHIETGDITLVR